MSCKVCRGPDAAEYRRNHGCDAETDQVLIEVHGTTDEPVPLYRCPNAEIDPRALEVIEHATLIGAQVSGAWPVDGGTRAQSATFLPALRLALGLFGKYREDAMKDSRR